ncbi:MAG: hypothetical protein V1799_00750 [bacterium]
MRIFLLFLVTLMVSTLLFGQTESTNLDPFPKDQFQSAHSMGRYSKSLIRPVVGYGSFSFGDESRSGPMVTIQYIPNRLMNPSIYLSGGVMLRFRKIESVPDYEFNSSRSLSGSTRFPNLDAIDNGYDSRLQVQTALGFVGSGLIYYFAEGDIAPYAGLGMVLPLWTYSSRINMALAPEAKLGLDVRFKDSFSGFIEVRHMVGVPTLLGSGPKFDGLTSVSIGASFAPKLK